MSDGTREERARELEALFRTAPEFMRTLPKTVPWILPPWVLAGGCTEVLGLAKEAGKTTLVMRMVRSAIHQEMFLGEVAATRTPVVYLTEGPNIAFGRAVQRWKLENDPDLHIVTKFETRRFTWEETVDAAVLRCKKVGAKVLVIDTISEFMKFTGDGENNASVVLEKLDALRDLTEAGVGVVLVRHERKSGGRAAVAGRGSSAVEGNVDIVIAVRRPDGPGPETIRELSCLSRYNETPNHLAIDLANDYQAAGIVSTSSSFSQTTQDMVLGVAPVNEDDAMTLQDFVDEFDDRPGKTAVRKALKKLVADGKLQSRKVGRAMRYWQSAQQPERADAARSPPPSTSTATTQPTEDELERKKREREEREAAELAAYDRKIKKHQFDHLLRGGYRRRNRDSQPGDDE